MRLLVTRPAEDGARTAAALRARGHDVLLAPLMRVEAITDADLGAPPWSGVLMSSANAARAIATHPRLRELTALPLLAVGKRTADAAGAAGFKDVGSADGDARDLNRMAAERFAGRAAPLLYLAGEDRAHDVPVRGMTLVVVAVYRAIKCERLPQPAQDAIAAGRIDGVLHFSLRSAQTYAECARAAGLLDKALAPLHFCLSARVATALPPAAAVRIAARPDEAALLDLVESR